MTELLKINPLPELWDWWMHTRENPDLRVKIKKKRIQQAEITEIARGYNQEWQDEFIDSIRRTGTVS